MKIGIPKEVKKLMEQLGRAGYESYVVGGCVRDFLMGKKPLDWDLCTSATPEQMKIALSQYKTFDVGIDHGTVGIGVEGEIYELTTYRIDGPYLDRRHPECVVFTPSITEDLARRDFTINAMAYNEDYGFLDPYGGKTDLEQGIIRCVGMPEKRFEEDGLRILRGLRFASVLGFTIEEKTAKAMENCKDSLNVLPLERVNQEFSKFLVGDHAGKLLMKHLDIFRVFAPVTCPENILNLNFMTGAGEWINPTDNLAVRLAILFPKNTEEILKELKFSKDTVTVAAQLAKHREDKLNPDRVDMKKLMKKLGYKMTVLLIKMKEAYGEDVFWCQELVEDIVRSAECYSLKQLKVNGNDLMQVGIPKGVAMGQALEQLFLAVIQGKIENERESLLREVKEMVKGVTE